MPGLDSLGAVDVKEVALSPCVRKEDYLDRVVVPGYNSFEMSVLDVENVNMVVAPDDRPGDTFAARPILGVEIRASNVVVSV